MFGLLRRIPGYRLMLMVLVPAGIAAGAIIYLGRGTGGFQATPAERHVIEAASAEAADALAKALPPGKVLLAPLVGDDGYATAVLKADLSGRGGRTVLEKADLAASPSLVGRINQFLEQLLGAPGPQEVNAGPMLEAATAAGVPGVVFGRVVERSGGDGHTRFALAVRGARSADGGTVLMQEFRRELRHSWRSAEYLGVWLRSRAWWGRVLVWVVAAAALPLVLGGATKRLLAAESNAVNAALLAFLTLVDGAAAWLLMAFSLGGAALLLTGLAAVAALVYNYVILDRQVEAAA